MPIRAALRQFYDPPVWGPVRRRILERAGGRFDARGKYLGGACCEQCGKPHRRRVRTVTALKLPDGRPWMLWFRAGLGWRDCEGQPYYGVSVDPFFFGYPRNVRLIRVVLTVAHLNHVAGDDRDENLKALCQWCHLNYDRLHHHETRGARKDAARPLFQEVSDAA
jgi:hypothetical protein